MKSSLILIFLFYLALMCEAQQSNAIHFEGLPWSETLGKAKKTGKPVFLYVYAPSCGFCRKMENEVFTEQQVADFYNTHFLNFKIDIEDGAEGAALAKQYGVVSYPTYMYFDKNGVLLHQSGSSKPALEFILDGQHAMDPDKALFALKRKYDAGDRSADLLYNYSNALGFYHQAASPEEAVVAAYMKTQSASDLLTEKNLNYIFSKHLPLESAATQFFLKNHIEFASLFEEEEVKLKVKRIIRQSAHTAGRTEDVHLFKRIKEVIASDFQGNEQLTQLADIYYYQGQRAWLPYAEATLAYGKNQGADDWRTLHETALYLEHFARDEKALMIGAQIMESMVKAEKSYDNLLLSAQLQHKVGRSDQALQTATEAMAVARKTGAESSEASALINALHSVVEN